MRRVSIIALATIGLFAAAGVAQAGMPSASYTITELSRIRIQTLSFFLAAFFVSAGGIMFLWNCLARDFAKLPRITYGRSLALMSLWGLLFVLVLTMISGARELMTPGAWERNGVTYKLADPVSTAD